MAPELAGRRVTVCGLGLFGGGAGCARWLADAGARVTVTDLRGADELAPSIAELDGLGLRFVLGRHDERDFTAADLVVANPAVPPRSRYLAAARAAGVPITSEIALGLGATRARWIGVTGTHGKSSTVAFLERTAASLARRVVRAGNLGGALVGRADALDARDLLVLELSSYQLEALTADPSRDALPRAAAVVVTNVDADHLDRHGDVETYARVKGSIVALAAADAPVCLPVRGRASELSTAGRPPVRVGAEASGADLFVADGAFRDGETALGRVADFAPAGSFQRLNALVALGVAHRLGARPADLAATVAHLAPPPHRLERLPDLDGHAIWDNGVSTTPESTLAALESLPAPCVALLGGRDKGLEWTALASALARRGDRAIAFGDAGPEIARRLERAGVAVRVARDLERAVELALAWRDAREALLFSPACASFDAYRNFADRARAFRGALDARRS